MTTVFQPGIFPNSLPFFGLGKVNAQTRRPWGTLGWLSDEPINFTGELSYSAIGDTERYQKYDKGWRDLYAQVYERQQLLSAREFYINCSKLDFGAVVAEGADLPQLRLTVNLAPNQVAHCHFPELYKGNYNSPGRIEEEIPHERLYAYGSYFKVDFRISVTASNQFADNLTYDARNEDLQTRSLAVKVLVFSFW